jgi:hypothetical protein
MVRWIAFDDETAEAVVSRFRRGAAEIERGDPISLALEADRPAVVILPSETPGRVLLAKITPNSESLTYEPGGFLGLTDEPVARRTPVAPPARKRSWWKNPFRHS